MNVSWKEELRAQNSAKASARYVLTLSPDIQEEFSRLPVKEQADLLLVSDRRYNRFQRECKGLSYVMEHCTTLAGKPKQDKWAVRSTNIQAMLARQDGYKSPQAMREDEERREAARNKGKKANAEQERLSQLVAQIEYEERNNIL